MERVELKVNPIWIQGEIERQLTDSIQMKLWFVDVDMLSKLMCMSVRYLESEILSDARMKAIEVRKSRKRWWRAEDALKVIEEITAEWNNS